VVIGSFTITPADQLDPGETACFPYETIFTPVPGGAYKNTARASSTNFLSGNTTTLFNLPSVTVTEIDEAASIADVASCPAGFTCAPSATGPWHLTGSGNTSYSVIVTNRSAACDSTHKLDNTATLTENDTKTVRSDGASVTITTARCDADCTQTIGFWKTHDGTHGRNADLVTQHLPIWLGSANGAKSVLVTNVAQAVAILNKGNDASNGINKLKAQLLGAKLNIAEGASSSAIASALQNADAFLAMYASAGWASLSSAKKQLAIRLAGTFDDYNNGDIGPGHCDERCEDDDDDKKGSHDDRRLLTGDRGDEGRCEDDDDDCERDDRRLRSGGGGEGRCEGDD
jgi:hypothetical protein